MPNDLQPESLAELTILAMRSRARRFDWDWIMCYHIRQWEAANVAEYASEGHPLTNGHFSWFHWHEICDRVFARALEERHRARQAIADAEDRKALSAYGEYLCKDLLYPQCEGEFARMALTLQDHGLKL